MVAAYSWKNENRFRMTGYDGWNELLGGWYGQVKVQNAATTLASTWPIREMWFMGALSPWATVVLKAKGCISMGITREYYTISQFTEPT